MKARTSFAYLSLALGGLLTLPVGAADLDSVLADVLETHPEILEMQKSYNAAVQDMRSVVSQYRPTLDLQSQAGHQEIDNRRTLTRNRHDTLFGVRVGARKLLYDGNRVGNDTRAHRAVAQASLYAYLGTANAVAFDTVRAYLFVLKNHELLKLAKERLDVHEKLLESVRFRMESGQQGKSELERVQGRLAAAQSQVIARENDYQQSVYNLHRNLGRFLDGKEMTTPRFDDSLLPASLDEALRRQIDSHPSLKEVEKNIEQRQWEHRRERGEYAGRLHLEASRWWRDDFNGIDGHETDDQLLLTYNHTLFDGGVRRHRSARMRSLIHKEQEVQNRVRRTLMNDLQLTWSAYRLLANQVGALKKNLFFTRKALRTYKEEFRIGRRLFINILDAENEYQNARAQLAAVLADLRIQKFRILFSQGTLIGDTGHTLEGAEELIKQQRPRRHTPDTLHLDLDFDDDGVPNETDLSVNSLPDSVVDQHGSEAKASRTYLENALSKARQERINRIQQDNQLRIQPIRPDVVTQLEFVTFLKGSLELSYESKELMRDLIEQLRPLAPEGLIQVFVSTDEFDSDVANRQLALRRAYNFKRILVDHDIDASGVQVYGESGISQDSTAKKDNSVRIKVVTRPVDYAKDNEVVQIPNFEFERGEDELYVGMIRKVRKLADDLLRRDIAAVDVVVYSNDHDNPLANQELSLRRAKAVRLALVEAGMPEARIFLFGWGRFQENLLMGGKLRADSLNRVDFVLRSE